VNGEQSKVLNSDVTVAILAGGKSSRFGSDKALAPVPGELQTFLVRAAEVARAVADEVIVIGPERAGLEGPKLRFIPDQFPGEGPAGGIITALSCVATGRLIVLACDQPLIASTDLTALLEGAEDHPAVAFASRDGGIQPLPCLFDVAACRDKAISAFQAGTRSLRGMLAFCGLESINVGGDRRLTDIDTVDDYRALADSIAASGMDGPTSG
jgi:molybdopterin-guanine dinucleotide biosynthesis protein A